MVSLSGETIYRGRRVWYFISFRPDGNVKSLSHSEVRDHLCGLYPIR
jgi:hypothetical protein